MAEHPVVRYWNPIVIFSCFLMYLIVGYLTGYYNVNLRPYVPWVTPLLAWIGVSKQMRSYFRFRWFWWTSGLFVVVSGLIVSTSILARANMMLWMVIGIIEAALFLGLVDVVASGFYGIFNDE